MKVLINVHLLVNELCEYLNLLCELWEINDTIKKQLMNFLLSNI